MEKILLIEHLLAQIKMVLERDGCVHSRLGVEWQRY